MRFWWVSTAVIAAVAPNGVAAAPPLVVQSIAGSPGSIRVVLSGPEATALRQRLGDAPGADQVEPFFSIALAGQTTRIPLTARLSYVGSTAVLTPAFPLSAGRPYEILFDGPRLGGTVKRLSLPYSIAVDTSPSNGRVTRLFPTQTTLPANQLKFYAYFSKPMGEGEVFKHVRLLNERGQPVVQAFHEVELWSENHTRLTLLINPGRTKRDLGLSESLGPVLLPNKRYTLQIGPGLKDQQGRVVAAAYRSSFTTAPHDRSQPRIASWKISPPRAGTRQPLRLRFDEPMDYALATDRVDVLAAGKSVPGRVVLSATGKEWTLTPTTPWTAGVYDVVAGGEVEDLAGNSLYRAFETEAGKGQTPIVNPPDYRIKFRVK